MKNWKKSQVVMLPTEKVTDIRIGKTYNKLHYKNNTFDKEFGIYQHLCILSDEQAKEGDWVLYNNKPCKVVSGRDFRIPMGLLIYTDHKHIVLTRDNNKKIIATTDESLKISKTCIICDGNGEIVKCTNIKQSNFKCNHCNAKGSVLISLPRLSDEFLKKYCELGGIDEVLVKYKGIPPLMDCYGVDTKGNYEYYCPICKEGGSYMGTGTPLCYEEKCVSYELVVNPDNVIVTILPEATTPKKDWTKEEIKALCEKAFNDGWDNALNAVDNRPTIKAKQWIRENL